MPNDLIKALMQSDGQPPGASPFGMDPPRPEDAINSQYRASTPKPSWLAPPPEPAPPGQGFWQGFAQNALKYAPLGLRAGGLGAAHRSPTTGQFIKNPAKNNAPLAAGAAAGAAGSGLIDWDKYADPKLPPNQMASAEIPTQPRVGGLSEVPKDNKMPMDVSNFGDRFGGMTSPSQAPAPEMPPWLQGAGVNAPPGAGLNVPLPRPKPPKTVARKAKPKPQTPVEESNPITQFLRSLGLG